MRVIYQRKKLFIDAIVSIYLFVIFLIGWLVSINKILAFSNGTNISNGTTNGHIGISIVQLMNNGTGDAQTNLHTLVSFILLFLILFLLANVFYYYLLSKQNYEMIKVEQMVVLALTAILFFFGANLFSIATQPADYSTLRVYGTGLFGITIFFSFLVVGVIELGLILYSFYIPDSIDTSAKAAQSTNVNEESLLKNKAPWIYVGFVIMAIQNFLILFVFFLALNGNLLDSSTANKIGQMLRFVLILDLIGILILAITSIYSGMTQKSDDFTKGGVLLAIWILISLLWRFGLPNFLYGNSSNSSSTVDVIQQQVLMAVMIFIGSFFLGFGLYFITKFLSKKFILLKFLVLVYAILDILCSLAFPSIYIFANAPGIQNLVGGGVMAKILLVPPIGIIMYVFGIIYLHKYQTKTKSLA